MLLGDAAHVVALVTVVVKGPRLLVLTGLLDPLERRHQRLDRPLRGIKRPRVDDGGMVEILLWNLRQFFGVETVRNDTQDILRSELLAEAMGQAGGNSDGRGAARQNHPLPIDHSLANYSSRVRIRCP